ncbi:paired amphipathic helix protein Sin3a [Paragonimus westermani]|uniref:Paired amphipathic helix protein Sin3a n=2 Tax=Paragonimus westermani TaxID=34504 RepID=A0A5J4NYC3_9TREM|nr:paired amphipathic helix protein Sin3a [Paragonimus westermani]
MTSLKVEDALFYLDEVKERFAGQEAIYMDFLEVMREFKTQTIGTEVVIRRVRELFDGHPDLIEGFNNFIPQGYRMDTVSSRGCATAGCRASSVTSATENISPTKTFTTNSKSEGTDWTIPGCVALNVARQLECTTRSGFGPPVVSGTTLLSESATVRSFNSMAPPEASSAVNSQPILGSMFQENLANSAFRGPCGMTPNAGIPNAHIYQQQQQQAQSFNHAVHYVNKIKVGINRIGNRESNQLQHRFQGFPDVYKRFLDILQWYQKEQRHSDPLRGKQAEKQVYQDVAKLFDGQEDLLQEFSMFLPESTGVTNAVTEAFINRKISGQQQSTADSSSEMVISVPQVINRVSEGISMALSCRQRLDSTNVSAHLPTLDAKKLKRLAPAANTQTSLLNASVSATKKARSAVRDTSVADVNQLASGLDISLLHKIRLLLEADNAGGDRSYQTFLQTLSLFNRNLITADTLLESTRPLFPRNIDVWKRFCDMISTASPRSQHDQPTGSPDVRSQTVNDVWDKEKCDREWRSSNNIPAYDSINFQSSPSSISAGNNHVLPLTSDGINKRLDLDFAKLRTCGTSYRVLPASFPQSKCSGRLKCPVAREVLNDSFISFSSLTSEDSQFVSSKKNQYEEHMYRVEDERYEVDMVTELNRAAMQNLVVAKRRMDRMTQEELSRFTLDDNLGGTSAILMRKAIHRVYGDKAGDVIYGLKNCPSKVVPVVIQRMRQKDSEWREAIRTYQRSWEEQDARNYLRSLDHQGASFKQRDAPLIRSKTMVSQIDAIARDDRHWHIPADPIGAMISASLTQHCLITRTDLKTPGTFGSALINVNEGYRDPGAPHLSLVYPSPAVRNLLLEDAASLIIHHVKRQTNTSKEDKRTMKFLMRTVVQDFFMAERFPMSDDEEEDDEDDFDHKDEKYEAFDELINGEEGGRTRASRLSRMRRFKESKKIDSAETLIPRTISNDVLIGEKPHDSYASGTDSRKTSAQVNCVLECSGVASGSERANCSGHTRVSGTNDGHSSTYDPRQVDVPHSSTFPREEHYTLLYGNNHWYAFLRLHHLLLCRLHLFRSRSTELSIQATIEKNSTPIQAAEVLRLKRHGEMDPSDYYGNALNLVKDLLDGGEDVNRYEDRLRNMFGIYAYPWFTLDRLVINIVRQLHALTSGDELSSRLTALHRTWTYGSTLETSCNSPLIYRHNYPSLQGQGSVTSQFNAYRDAQTTFFSGVCGPLCTRVCRLANEAAYRAQALSLTASFANSSGGSNQSGSNTSISGGQTNGGGSTAVTSMNIPNCYAMVMLTEASTLLIRLVLPTITPEGCDLGIISHSCPATHQGFHPATTTLDRDHTLSKRIICSNAPARHWHDYLRAHLVWTLGTVRRCVKALAQRAFRKRQQQLIDTGDTQPEELFRDTFSSDRMEFTDRLTTKANPRNHKINWCVGSYGIFIRRKQRKVTTAPSARKWHEFHAHWFSKHAEASCFDGVVPQLYTDKDHLEESHAIGRISAPTIMACEGDAGVTARASLSEADKNIVDGSCEMMDVDAKVDAIPSDNTQSSAPNSTTISDLGPVTC